MNILYKSKLTKVMGSTTGEYEIAQIRGQKGSRGGRPALKYGGSWENFAGTLSRAPGGGGVC
jgi:hypothetical protein